MQISAKRSHFGVVFFVVGQKALSSNLAISVSNFSPPAQVVSDSMAPELLLIDAKIVNCIPLFIICINQVAQNIHYEKKTCAVIFAGENPRFARAVFARIDGM